MKKICADKSGGVEIHITLVNVAETERFLDEKNNQPILEDEGYKALNEQIFLNDRLIRVHESEKGVAINVIL
jgi:hypothetical protein